MTLKGYTVLEARPHTQGPDFTAPVAMLEVSSEGLKAASDAELDQLLENYLGISPRSFWTRQKKINMLLVAASEIVDSLD